MDKVTPKSDVFKANLDRAAPLLKALRADGIGHMIDGKVVASISGDSFETKSPIDGSVLATVARGNAEDIDRAATAAALAFKAWRDMPASMRKKLLHRVADAIEERADDIAVLECIDTGQAHRFMAKAAIRAAENFRFFADKCADARDGLNMPSEEHWNVSTRVPIGPVGVITPWNTPFMLSTWKIAPALAAGCTVVHKPAEWSPVTADLLAKLVKAGGRARRRPQHRARHRRGSRQGADRAPRDQGDRLCRRERDGIGDHGAGRADPEARAFRARRQEPRDRVRRRRSRSRARCGRIHDLLAQRRALHLVEPASDPARHRRKIRRKARRAGKSAEGRPSPRSPDRNRAADPRAASGKGLLLFRRRAAGWGGDRGRWPAA